MAESLNEHVQNILGAVNGLIQYVEKTIADKDAELKKYRDLFAQIRNFELIPVTETATAKPVTEKAVLPKKTPGAKGGSTGPKKKPDSYYQEAYWKLASKPNLDAKEKNKLANLKWRMGKLGIPLGTPKNGGNVQVNTALTPEKAESFELTPKEPEEDGTLYKCLYEQMPGLWVIDSINLERKVAEEVLLELQAEGKKAVMKPMKEVA